MSDLVAVPPIAENPAKRVPTVYFIDDSATMREVIKIAFRRENINIITCPNAASAFDQFEQNPPDAVITDVIMPDQDGYSVCTQVKEHPRFGATPVILMSGVVNKSVADKALAVQADELIRKPFQPQELIARVKNLLEPKGAEPEVSLAATSALDSLFARAPQVPPPAPEPPAGQRPDDSETWPCRMCGRGTYRSASPSGTRTGALLMLAQISGGSVSDRQPFSIFICDRCGHAELFKAY